MIIEQIYTGCLAQGAYYIESEGEAAIIDPLRETGPYIKRAKKDGTKIKYIFETHFHADFVSGHLELAKKTGADIIYGTGAKPDFDFIEAVDGKEFKLGKITIKALHTPGHTLESTTYLLMDENKKKHAIFTGDALFIGDVGRPDLAQAGELTQENLAGMLYNSLRSKIMPLPDDVIIYPAHGEGSACGKKMSHETHDTLGHQKQVNYALRANMTKEEFIKEVTADIPPPPKYFVENVKINKAGAGDLDDVMKHGKVALSAAEFEAIVNQTGAVMLDTRDKEAFIQAHIPNSIFIGLKGNFAPWSGTLIPDLQQPIVFIAEEGKEEEVVQRLSRVGLDNTLGYLEGGIEAWQKAGKETDFLQSISAKELAKQFGEDINILDVRNFLEWKNSHIDGSKNIPLSLLSEKVNESDKNKTYYIHCKTGYRGLIATSILKARGYQNVTVINDHYSEFAKNHIPCIHSNS